MFKIHLYQFLFIFVYKIIGLDYTVIFLNNNPEYNTENVFIFSKALVERVFLRIGSAETDEQLQSALERFLPPVLLKLDSKEDGVRKKVGYKNELLGI